VDETVIQQQIISDLTGTQKKISSVLFYDAAGSTLFERITTLPEYYLTKTEIGLLHQAATSLPYTDHQTTIVEFGSGDCTKISILLEAITKQQRKQICYMPVDISRDAIEKSSYLLSKRFPEISIHGIIADFLTQLHVISHHTPTIWCFLGSTIGNLSMDDALLFLQQLSKQMHQGDILLLGLDMVKQTHILEQAYNDSQLVTEQFNKHILTVVNDRIHTCFDPETFDHVAFYNTSDSRIEMHLKATQDMFITSPLLSKPLSLKKGETIHTENSHKFTPKHIAWFAESTGLDIEQLYTDDQHWFSLVQFQKNSP